MQLRRCGTPADFDARSLELLRHLVALDPRLPLPPAAAGLRARVLGTVRRTLWRLLGGPLDRLALQQTRINELLLDAIRRMSLRDDSPQPPPPAPLS